MLWVLKGLIQAIWKAFWRRAAVDMSPKEYFSSRKKEIEFHFPKMILWNEP